MAGTPRDVLRDQHQAALDELIEPIEAAVAAFLRAILTDAVDAMLGAHTAAIDLHLLAAVTDRWNAVVDERLIPMVAGVYEAGALSTFISWASASDRRIATMTERLAGDFTEVVPQAAVDYMQGSAVNRLRGIGQQGWALVREAVVRGLNDGDDIDTIAAATRDAIDVSTTRARTIARTETIGAANAGSIRGARALAPHGGPQWKEWLATKDSRTRPSHVDADGQVVRLDDTFTVGGARMDRPGDGPAAEVVNCRCTIVYREDPPPGQPDLG